LADAGRYASLPGENPIGGTTLADKPDEPKATLPSASNYPLDANGNPVLPQQNSTESIADSEGKAFLRSVGLWRGHTPPGDAKLVDKPATQPSLRPMSSENKLSERDGWIFGGVGAAAFSTILGVGLFGYYENHPIPATIFSIIGACGLVAMAILLKGHRLTVIHTAIAALVATWTFFGYTIWFGPQVIHVPPTIIHVPATAADSAKTTPTPATEPAEIPTFLRLQFDAEGKAQEIDKKNLTWRAINPIESQLVAAPTFFGSCPDNTQPYVQRPQLGVTIGSADPGYCLQKTKTWVFTLSFDAPISYKKLRLNSHGAALPEWDNTQTTSQFSIVTVHGELKNMVLDVTLVN
jgi:hypothetical protein